MIARGAATALLALAFGLLALASERVDRLEARAARDAARTAVPAPGVDSDPAVDALALELADALERLEREAEARSSAAPTPVPEGGAAASPPADRLAVLYREELRRTVRAGVLATLADRAVRLEREVAPPARLRPAVRAALARTLAALADRCADRVESALANPTAASFAGLEEEARAHLRQELARVLGTGELERFDAGTSFREGEEDR